MAYTINKTDNSTLVTIADGTKNDTTDLTLVGKNFTGYGEFLNENFVRLLENFSNTTAPQRPIDGQLWWNRTPGILNVRTSTGWKTIASLTTSATAPAGAATGDLWWDSSNKQLKVFDGTGYNLIGPASPAGAGVSGALVETITDTPLGASHVIVRFYVNNTTVAILSKDAQFTPAVAIAGFPVIYPGMNLATTAAIAGIRLTGTSSNSDTLDNLDSTSFLRGDGGALGVANGGTGATTLTGIVIGNGTGAFTTKINPTGDIVGTTANQTLTNKTLNIDNNVINGFSNSSFVLTTSDGRLDGSVGTKAIPIGTVVGTSDTQILTNKTISADDNIIGGLPASSFVVTDATGKIDGAASQRAMPAGDVVGTTATQTLTNKTLNSPVIADATISGTLTGNLVSTSAVTATGLVMPSVGVERQVQWNLTGKNLYIYARDSDDSIGVFDSGTQQSRWSSDVSGNFVAAGNVTAYSDLKLKKDLNKISDALAKVQALTGYTYTRTDTGERQTGLIAQDVEKVLPEAVSKFDDVLALAYGNMVGLLVEAVKELAEKIEKLENK